MRLNLAALRSRFRIVPYRFARLGIAFRLIEGRRIGWLAGMVVRQVCPRRRHRLYILLGGSFVPFLWRL
jgi:hypothetical protein